MESTEPIARLVIERRVLPEAAVRRAQSEHGTQAGFLAALLKLGAPESELAALAAEHLGIPAVDLSRTTIDLDVLDTIPRLVAESDLVLPLSTEGGRLHVAVNAADPESHAIEEVRFITGREVSPYAALPGLLEQAVAAAYDAKERGERFWHGPGLMSGAGPGVSVILPGNRPGSLGQPRTEEIYEDTIELEREEIAVEVGAEEDDVEVLHAVEVRVGPSQILAVDDDPDILRLLDRTLRSAGHSVELAKDGREAEQKLKNKRYDLVVLDAMLPHVHGFEICSRLKASAKTREIPVILISAVYRGWRYAHDARETFGAEDFLEKPFHLPELLRIVQLRLGTAAPPPPSTAKADKLFEEGMGLLEAKRPAEARAALESAAKVDPFSARTHFALGRALQEQGDLFQAITAYERAVELRPNLFQGLRALAGLYEQKGFRRKAVESLERALHASPDVKTRAAIRERLIKLL